MTWAILAFFVFGTSFANAEDPDALLVFTGSNRGELRPCGCPGAVFGGLAQRATILDQLRKEKGAFMLVDAGDALFPDEVIGASTRAPRQEAALGVLRAMKAMSYDYVLLTERDKDPASKGFLSEPLIREWLTADPAQSVKDDALPVSVVRWDESGYPSIKDTHGVVVALTGLSDAELAESINPKHPPWLVISSAVGATLSEPLLTWVSGVPVIRPTPKGKELGLARFWTDAESEMIQGGLERVDDGLVAGTFATGRRRVSLELRKIPRSTDIDSEIMDLVNEAELRAEQSNVVPPWQEWSGQTYASVAACVGCHPAQTSQWENSAHARAWASLQADNSHRNLSCIGCHSTGKGVVGGYFQANSVGMLQDVQCEVCHGPSLQHVYDPERVMPPVRRPESSLCAKCHTSERSSEAWKYDWAIHVAGCRTN